jgi:hypothetical protein
VNLSQNGPTAFGLEKSPAHPLGRGTRSCAAERGLATIRPWMLTCQPPHPRPARISPPRPALPPHGFSQRLKFSNGFVGR